MLNLKSFEEFVNESIWSDMQDRSTGDVVRKEDNKSDKVESEEEEIELPKLIDKNTENMYDEPEMPKTIEKLQKEKNKNQKVDLIDGIFTIEEIKQLRKMLNELNKK